MLRHAVMEKKQQLVNKDLATYLTTIKMTVGGKCLSYSGVVVVVVFKIYNR